MAGRAEHELLMVAGREVAISNPGKVLFPQPGYTKLDLARYYVAVAQGAVRAPWRPMFSSLSRWHRRRVLLPERAPRSRPSWIEAVALQLPLGRTAEEVVPRDAAALVWMANLACLELDPHRRADASTVLTSCASISIRCAARSGRRS